MTRWPPTSRCAAAAPTSTTLGRTGSPGYGSETSPVMIVGQSLCKLCMKYGEPFRGGSGWFPTKRSWPSSTNGHVHVRANVRVLVHHGRAAERETVQVGMGLGPMGPMDPTNRQ